MTLMLALLLEWLLGDPQSRWHPVAVFGRWASWVEQKCYGDTRSAGMHAWLWVVLPPLSLLWLGHSLLGWWFDVLLLWVCIGWKSLLVHVRAVLMAEGARDAREAVSRIVSRDTAAMSLADARCAALESLAENASDAVLAPLFWFVLLGPIGAALYRMTNTLDAMWGYRNERYQAFGWCAARMDDAANWLPARITARLMLRIGHETPWTQVKKQAVTHASPNAGWPETALAFAANVQLGGPVWRQGMKEIRPFYGRVDARPADDRAAGLEALQVTHRALLLGCLLALGVSFVVHGI